MNVKERVIWLCKVKGISVSQLERDCGFANAYVRQMNPETVQYIRLKKIADYFEKSVEFLMTGENDNYHTTDAERDLLEAFRRADDGTQAAVCKLLDIPNAKKQASAS